MNVLKMFDLTGKVAIVTGGSRGFGKEIAIGFGEAGAKVAIVARSEEWLNPTYEEIKGMGIDCLAFKNDVRNLEEVKQFTAETINKWGKLDILVNNAGVSWGGVPATEFPQSHWDRVMATNVTAMLLCSQEVAKQMIRQKSGGIINMSSAMGVVGISPEIMRSLVYHTSKAAVIGLTKQLAVEWAPHNIRVNAMAPFFFPTRLTKPILDVESAKAKMLETIPMKRLGKEGEIKGVALFLASDASSYITGQILGVDGGLTAW